MKQNPEEWADRQRMGAQQTLVLGTGLGILLGAAFDNPGFGLVLGAARGLAPGAVPGRSGRD